MYIHHSNMLLSASFSIHPSTHHTTHHLIRWWCIIITTSGSIRITVLLLIRILSCWHALKFNGAGTPGAEIEKCVPSIDSSCDKCKELCMNE